MSSYTEVEERNLRVVRQFAGDSTQVDDLRQSIDELGQP